MGYWSGILNNLLRLEIPAILLCMIYTGITFVHYNIKFYEYQQIQILGIDINFTYRFVCARGGDIRFGRSDYKFGFRPQNGMGGFSGFYPLSYSRFVYCKTIGMDIRRYSVGWAKSRGEGLWNIACVALCCGIYACTY